MVLAWHDSKFALIHQCTLSFVLHIICFDAQVLLSFRLFIQDSVRENNIVDRKKEEKDNNSSSNSITVSSLTPSLKEEGKKKDDNNSSSLSSLIPSKISSNILIHVRELQRLLCSVRLIVLVLVNKMFSHVVV